jgi:hypothetical protein
MYAYAVLRGRATSMFCVYKAYVSAGFLALPAAQDKQSRHRMGTCCVQAMQRCWRSGRPLHPHTRRTGTACLRHRRLRQPAELCSARLPCLRPRPHTSRACGRLCMYGTRIDVMMAWLPRQFAGQNRHRNFVCT